MKVLVASRVPGVISLSAGAVERRGDFVELLGGIATLQYLSDQMSLADLYQPVSIFDDVLASPRLECWVLLSAGHRKYPQKLPTYNSILAI